MPSKDVDTPHSLEPNVLSKPKRQRSGEHAETADGTVTVPLLHRNAPHGNEASPAAPPAAPPAPHGGYLLSALSLTGLAGLLSIASIVTAAFVFYVVGKRPGKDDPNYRKLSSTITICGAVTLVDGIFSLIAMAVCFGLLLGSPHAVLIRSPRRGSLVCLCVSVVVLFLFAVFSFGAVIGCAVRKVDDALPAGVCVAPAVRMVALIGFFAVLVANSRVLPHDSRL